MPRKSIRKTIRDFVRENRLIIDAAIVRILPRAQYFNDQERRQWVQQDQHLYNWARSEGVRV